MVGSFNTAHVGVNCHLSSLIIRILQRQCLNSTSLLEYTDKYIRQQNPDLLQGLRFSNEPPERMGANPVFDEFGARQR